jgi:thymidine kinase
MSNENKQNYNNEETSVLSEITHLATMENEYFSTIKKLCETNGVRDFQTSNVPDIKPNNLPPPNNLQLVVNMDNLSLSYNNPQTQTCFEALPTNNNFKISGNRTCGRLILIYGPMCSGKSTYLGIKVSEQEAIGKKVLFINSSLDTRSPDNDDTIYEKGIISTHNHRTNQSTPSRNTKYLKIKNIKDIPFCVNEFDVIAIDEAQFFDDLTEVINIILHNKITVYVAGLMATSEGNLFGKMHQLIPYADKTEPQTALCKMCFLEKNQFSRSATMTFCLDKKTEETLVGSKQYVPMCLSHWNFSNFMQMEGRTDEIKKFLTSNEERVMSSE